MIERIVGLLKTGKASISTNKLTLFVWEDYDGTIFEVTGNCDSTDEEIIYEYISHPYYQGKSFSEALKVLEDSIK